MIRRPDAEVLFLDGLEYTMIGRWRTGEVAESHLLPGFQVAVAAVLTGES
ncbi:MAG: hypothetical protein KIT22_01575 [Verrucomicrobiae bacterium]|nr:hypothetical protein [Verrucomicrobiae bacterium]